MDKLANSRLGRHAAVERAGVTVTRVGANLGAEIGGVDLRRRLADETFNVILDALAEENELLIFATKRFHPTILLISAGSLAN